MNTTAILKKALIKILRKSPATLDLVMDCCTDLILERADHSFDLLVLQEKLEAEEAAWQMMDMILHQQP